MAEKTKKPKSKARKIIEWVLFGIFGFACAVVLAANISAMVNKKKNYGQSIRFGESVGSTNGLKFGLCEGATLEFDTFFNHIHEIIPPI